MKITTVLFDLDGTLLPMDQDLFIKIYFGNLAKKLAPYGYDPKELMEAIWKGTAAMVKNDGSSTNETVFWNYFSERFGAEKAKADYHLFEAFYQKEFDESKSACGYDKRAKQVVDLCKERGLRVALSTNPIFPSIATEKRMSWAGLSPSDFELFTTYENSATGKPNPAYFLEVAEKMGVAPEECLVVGNDATEDVAASKVGMQVFLLTPCLINKGNIDINAFPNGDFDTLISYISNLEV